MDHIINSIQGGVHNLLDDENIPTNSAQDALNWFTQDGRIKLSYGKTIVGAEGSSGKITGLHFGYKVDGTKVFYRKIETKIQYLNGTTWTDVLTGLTSNSEYTFANYSSLAGAFTFINGVDGYWKINNANPTSPIQMYNSAKNFHGKIIIAYGRTILWDRNDTNSKDKTGLYGSKIDPQNTSVYTTVTAEILGASGATTYTGTLAFKSGGATRNCFGVSVVGTVAAGTETFSDNFNGTLTSDRGGTGTINYATGAYSVTFSAVTTAGNVTSTYKWEDSNIGGLTDFTYSATRIAGEGFVFPQDEGGDAILTILLGQDGAFYSLKSQSAYRLTIAPDDLNTSADNEVYRKDIGIPNFRAASSTSKGIVFMNTANPDKPELTILQRNPLGNNIEPVSLFPQFKFSNYEYDDCAIETFERYIVITCRTSDSTTNNRMLLCDMTGNSVDILGFGARIFAKDAGNLYIGSPVSQSVYKVLNGFDDDGYPLENYWTSKGETYIPQIQEKLKKFKKLRFSGKIDPDQSIEVYISYDDGGFSQVGTIYGKAGYVDYNSPQVIGGNVIGEVQIGGDDISEAYPFYMEIKLSTPKFRKRTIKLIATGIGYAEIDSMLDYNIFTFESRIPKRFREKQNVSLDGTTTNN